MRSRLTLFFILTCIFCVDTVYPDEITSEILNIENYCQPEEITEADFILIFDQSQYDFTFRALNPEINLSAQRYRRR
ncbi:MAG: hypothetical protein LUF90_07230 [Rikenellaceae bacterium]|nr:hypothetical protein [Rikenellaceae bacterium]